MNKDKLLKTDICIIGAGPGGLMAAIFALQQGARVLLIERNTSACRKLLHTGAGRCNLTHTGSVKDFIRAYGRCGRFLSYSLHEFSPDALRQYFSDRGLDTKADENGSVFPVTDRASDVLRVLIEHAESLSAQILYARRGQTVERTESGFIVHIDKEEIETAKVIISTGGVTWPATGSTGDGYALARSLGHSVIEPRASLGPVVTFEKWVSKLAGVAVESVRISGQTQAGRFRIDGPMLFTSNGIGGPAVLELSRRITDFLPDYDRPIEIKVDLLAKVNSELLNKQIARMCSAEPRSNITNIIAKLLPKSLAGELCEQASISRDSRAGQFSRTMRNTLVELIKALPLSVVSTCRVEQATVTRGGVALDEIESTTMQSKIVPGLYFAGEVIDADGPCGGYNLQIAFSTGRLAGISAGG